MKDELLVALIQCDVERLAPEANRDHVVALVEKEAKKGTDLVLLPELVNTGYLTGCGTADGVKQNFASSYVAAAELVPGPTTNMLAEIANSYSTHIVIGLAELHPNIPDTLYNSSVLIGPENLLKIHHKVHLPNYERFFFYSGSTIDVYETEIGSLGLMICYDLRFPEHARVLALNGVEIMCVSWSGSGGSVNDLDHIKYRAFTRAQENGCFVLVCNRVGEEEGQRFIGRSVVAAPHGEIIAYADHDEETVLRAELKSNTLLEYRANLNIFRDRRPNLYQDIVRSDDYLL